MLLQLLLVSCLSLAYSLKFTTRLSSVSTLHSLRTAKFSTSTRLSSVSTPSIVAYIALDQTLIDIQARDIMRPNTVPFLNALHEHNIECRLFTNNCMENMHVTFQKHLKDSNCKVTLPFPTLKDFYASGESKLTEWRRKNPQLGFVRVHVDEFMSKSFDKYILDPVEHRRAVLVDDDISYFWLLNIGQFVPAEPYDWENGLMDQVLPSLLKIQQGYHGNMPANITQQRLEAIALIEKVGAQQVGPRKLIDVLRTHPEADRLWYSTLAAFPGYTVEALLQLANGVSRCLDKVQKGQQEANEYEEELDLKLFKNRRRKNI